MRLKGRLQERIAITRGFILFLLSITFVLSNFFNWPLHNVLVWLTLISIVYSFPFMSRFPMIMTIVMMGLGHYFYFTIGADRLYWENALMKNLPLITMFVAVPLFAYPLRNGGYVQYITSLLTRVIKSPVKLFFNIVASSLALTSFINLGSARIIYELFEKYIKKNEKLFTTALAQGFSLSMCWSPYIAGVAIVISMLGLPIFPFILWGLLLVAAGVFISVLLAYKQVKAMQFPLFLNAGETETASASEVLTEKADSKGVEMIIAFSGMFVSLFVLDFFLETNIVVLISVIAFVYPIIWSIAIKKTKKFFRSLEDYKLAILPRMHNEANLFIAAAFFAEMIKLTSVPESLTLLFSYVSQLAPILVIGMTIFIVVFPSVIGIHQVLPVSILGTSISISSLSISGEAFGLALMAGWSLSTILSPVTGLNLTLSNLVKKPSYVIGFWNIQYVLIAFFSFVFIIYLINMATL